MKILALSLLLLSPLTLLATDQEEKDRKAVERAVTDYLEALYDVKPELIERSVHPDLTKLGFGRRGDVKEYRSFGMTYEQLHKLAGEWNDDGDNAGETSPRKVEVLDVLDQTAAAKLTAEWGIDYMHLAKFDGEWKIIHVLWQSHPPAAEAGYAK